MTASVPFTSYGQNGEDVVLNRALANIVNGSYVEVGANHPRIDSISRSFYDRGWSGLEMEANPAFAAMFRGERPRDTLIEAAVTDASESTITFHLIEGTGLSTLVDSISAEHAHDGFTITDVVVPTIRLDAAIDESGFGEQDIHFLVIDVEGAEAQVIRSIDLTLLRPWILVIESTSPRTTKASHLAWERIVLEAGYEFCLFDGLSRFYVAREKSAELKAALSYPACILDDYTTDREARLRDELGSAINRAQEAEAAILVLKKTVSWRVTRPLRAVRRGLSAN